MESFHGMQWNTYEKELRRHARYRVADPGRVRAEPLRWYRRPVMLALFNVVPLLGIFLLAWHTAGILWAFWAETMGLLIIAWTRTGSSPSLHPLTLGILTLLFLGEARLIMVLGDEEAFLRAIPRADHLLAGGLAAAVGLLLIGGHILPRPSRASHPMPQLLVLHAAIVFGGTFVLGLGSGLGYAFMLVAFKAVLQLSVAYHQESAHVVTATEARLMRSPRGPPSRA